ncbi:MAG: hypothetical protein QOE44_1909 [Solirubrobacteraceae bacterium]|nr:hypothetical protein [Solirubrobacteraceae bacterium]
MVVRLLVGPPLVVLARLGAACVVVVALLASPSSRSSAATPRSSAGGQGSVGLERAYAHNDYLHPRPLYDALHADFKSVEADVTLVHGKLLVGHAVQGAHADQTLESLYLEPLRRVVAGNGGSVYRGDPDYFTLLIDIKSAAGPTYLELNRELRRYRSVGGHRMFTTFGPSGVRDGAVTAIVSGNRPTEFMRRQQVRYAGYDGRLTDLGIATDQTLVPLISDAWLFNFAWNGIGPMPADERAKLRRIVRTAHANGQRVRFYLTPDGAPTGGVDARQAVWKELLAAHVDYINTDHLPELERFLLRYDQRPSRPWVSWGRHHR